MVKISELMFDYVSPITAALIIFFNMVEIIIIFKTRFQKKLNSSTVFILSICVSDLMVGFMIITVKILVFLLKNVYQGNVALRESIHVTKNFMLRLSLFLSVLNLMVFTYARMLAATKPIQYRKLTTSLVLKICYVIWLVSFTIVALYYCSMKFTLLSADYERSEQLIFPSVTYIVSIGSCYCYWIILKKIKAQKQTFRSAETTENKNDGRYIERRATYTAAATVCAFILCWTPLSTLSIVKASGSLENEPYSKDIENCLFILAFFNSVLNPFIYMFFSRDQVKRYLRRIIYKSQVGPEIEPRTGTEDV